MSTRQYVGARYVPKLSEPIEWDKKRGYEALEIVTYLGTSYTSKKPVPVGTEIDNNEYWVVTGNYNAQVEQYRRETAEVKTEMASVKTEFKAVKTEVGTLGTKVNDLGTSLENTNANVGELQNDVNDINTKLIGLTELVVIGDSYMTGYQPAGGNLSNPIANIIADSLGLNLHNYATNACGFTKGGDANTTFYQQCVNASEDSSFKNDKVKYVIIAGGRNDYEATPNPTGISSAITKCAEYCAKTFTQAEIIFIPMWDFNTPNKNIIKCVSDVSGYPLAVSGNGKIRTNSTIAFSYLGNNTLFYNNNDIHPSQIGANHMARNIVNFILGGDALELNAIDNYSGTWGYYDIVCEIRNGVAHVGGTASKKSTVADGDIILTTHPNMRPRTRLWNIGYNSNGDGISLFALEPDGKLKIWKNLTGKHSDTDNYGFDFCFPL